MADRFTTAYHRDPRVGYSSGFHALLRTHHTGAALRAALNPASDRSGAAMGTAPVGLLTDIDTVLHHTDVQARLTHDTPAGMEAARAAALAVHYCHHRVGPTRELAQWIADQLKADKWAQPWHGHVGAQGIMSTRAAITALAAAERLTDLLRALKGAISRLPCTQRFTGRRSKPIASSSLAARSSSPGTSAG